MNNQQTVRPFAFWILVLSLLVPGVGLVGSGCGAGPKGPSLLELESVRASNYARTVRINPEEVEQPRVRESRERAYRTIGQSDTYYNTSIEAWKASERGRSEELARQGLILHRAAEAYSRAGDARMRMEEANAAYQVQLERRNRYNDMVSANEEVISLLLALQRLYDQTEDCRAGQLAYSAEQESRNRAAYAVQMARSAQRDAENRRANQHASTVFNDGVRMLAQAISQSDSSQFDLAYETANGAASRFREAVTQSQTQFADIQRDMLRSSRSQELRDRAVQVFGDDAYLDARGLVIVLPNLFPTGRSEIRDDRTFLLDQVVELINAHRRIDVLVEGHTGDQGSRDSNQAIGASRAELVRNYFVQHEVRNSRLTVASFGEDFPRYDNREQTGQANNNRVEIVFLLED
ncbi:MAG: OmpA family protein [Bradymonadales bacterium]|nr:OmpA family protein [Bradymonadales bacterium]